MMTPERAREILAKNYPDYKPQDSIANPNLPQDIEPSNSQIYDDRPSRDSAQRSASRKEAPSDSTPVSISSGGMTPEKAKEILARDYPDYGAKKKEADDLAKEDKKNKLLAKFGGSSYAMGEAAGHTIKRLGQGAKQLLLKGGEAIGAVPEGSAAQYTEETNVANAPEDRKLAALSEAHPIATTAGEFVGSSVLSPVKGYQVAKGAITAGSSLGTRMGVGALQGAASGAQQGALYGAVNYDPTNESRASNIVSYGSGGALIGGGLGGIFGALGRIGAHRGFRDQASAEEGAATVAKAKELGINNMTEGMLNPEAKKLEGKILAGPESDARRLLLERKKNFEQEVVRASEDLTNGIPGNNLSIRESGKQIQKNLRSVEKEIGKDVSATYEKLKNTKEYNSPVELSKAREAFADVKENYANVSLPPSAEKLFNRVGAQEGKKVSLRDVLENPNDANLRKAYEAQGKETGKPPTFKEALDVAKNLGKKAKMSQDPAIKSAYKKLSDSIYESFDDMAAKDGASKEAVSLLAEGKAKRIFKGQLFEGKDIVQDIVKKKAIDTDKIKPEKIVGKIFSDELPAGGLGKIKRALEAGGPEGKATYDNLRQTTFQKVFNDATDTVGDRQVLNFKKLSKITGKIGSDGMKELIGDEKSYVKFKNLMDIMKRYESKGEGAKLPSENWLVKTLMDRPLMQKIPYFGNLLSEFIANRRFNGPLKQNFKIAESTTPMVETAPSNQYAQIAQNLVSAPNMGYNIANIPRGGIAALSNLQSRETDGNSST